MLSCPQPVTAARANALAELSPRLQILWKDSTFTETHALLVLTHPVLVPQPGTSKRSMARRECPGSPPAGASLRRRGVQNVTCRPALSSTSPRCFSEVLFGGCACRCRCPPIRQRGRSRQRAKTGRRRPAAASLRQGPHLAG